ncbi:RNA 2',3'-cyclic phosphodiesterase [Pseudomonas sp. GD03842]|uniref:RNA 2',3'-cyclic phosphodiesterase n=1 Tax=Pseudomonas sp. GD03842 TaxID=2975385 RepID=UPI00244721E5|nr:RNA 2',3'-cyclic phosphodiesterase [Pseudomonas sp. GD03842]MDH0748804.1 RNA 2',3'-cyclic phosphodiesterase [Pseudomonas sp. GD03842]
MSTEPQSRLFFAIGCSTPLKKEISRWRTSLSLRVGRPVPTANFHLTLLFLGSVDKAKIADLCTAASNVKVPERKLTVLLNRLEVWRKSGALVLTPENPPQEVMRLAYALEQSMLPFGNDQEQKEFRPHLTLARDYRLPVPEAPDEPAFMLRADRFGLYQSSKGEYRLIAEWPLVSTGGEA